MTEIHLFGVEDEADALGIADANAAIAGGTAAAAHESFTGDAEFVGLPGETLGAFGALAIGEVGPEGFDLLVGIAVEDFLSSGLTAGPVAGHDDGGVEAGGLAHVEVEPVLLNP